MGINKEKFVPRYVPHSEESKPKKESDSVFNDTYLEHHNIATLKWKSKQKEKKEGDTDD